MPTTTAAIVTDFHRPFEVKTVEKPAVSGGKVIVRIEAGGMCHTDLQVAHGDWPVKPEAPVIHGHEVVGVVAEGKVASSFAIDALENINGIFERMEQNRIDARIVLEM